MPERLSPDRVNHINVVAEINGKRRVLCQAGIPTDNPTDIAYWRKVGEHIAEEIRSVYAEGS